MVITDALKLLYKKLGGTADVDDITAISDMVDLIEDVAGGGGGGASGLVVTVSPVEGSETGEFSLDKNYTEIKNVIDSGIIPVFKLPRPVLGPSTGTQNVIYQIVGIGEMENEGNMTYIVELMDYSSDRYLFMSNSATGELIGTAE